MNSIYVLTTRFISSCIVFVFFTYENGKKLINVIIFFTDDQGYENFGCYGAEGFGTPNIDSMAKKGCYLPIFVPTNQYVAIHEHR